MKRFGDCPHCNGVGWLITLCYGAFDGLAKCLACRGFGLASNDEIESYHKDTQLTQN